MSRFVQFMIFFCIAAIGKTVLDIFTSDLVEHGAVIPDLLGASYQTTLPDLVEVFRNLKRVNDQTGLYTTASIWGDVLFPLGYGGMFYTVLRDHPRYIRVIPLIAALADVGIENSSIWIMLYDGPEFVLLITYVIGNTVKWTCLGGSFALSFSTVLGWVGEWFLMKAKVVFPRLFS